MQEKIEKKMSQIESHIQKVDDERLQYELRREMKSLNFLVQEGIKKEVSYFRSVSLTVASATGVILFWRGIYELTSRNTILSNPYLSLAIGMFILAATGLISKDFITVPGKSKATL